MEVPYLEGRLTMRHKGAGRVIKFLGPRVMSALQVWLWLLLFIFQNNVHPSWTAEPGYLDFDNLPDTNFSCAGKVIGGYYADLETDCQMFHVCTIGQLEEPMDIKFLCLNGTVFDQETRVCERVDEVDCSRSEHYYSLNLELYGNTAPPIIKADTPKSEDTNEDEEGEDEEYDIDEMYDEPSTTTKSTTIVTSTTPKLKEKTTTPQIFHTTMKPTYYHTTVQSSFSFHDPTSDSEDEAYELIDDNENSEPPVKNSSISNVPHYSLDSQLQRPSDVSQGPTKHFSGFDLTSIGEDDDKSSNVEDNAHHVYNPHELIYQHNNLGRKTPAVSFQQQSFSSDGQNSHVTVTTHTGGKTFNTGAPKTPSKTAENSQLSRTYLSSSTPNSNKSFKEKTHSFHNYPAFVPPKRTPLLPTPVAQGQIPTGHPGIATSKRQHQDEPLYFSFRKPALTPQGFKPNHSASNINLGVKPNVKSPAKPFQSYQPSERHEVSIESEFEFEKLTPTFPYIHQDFSQYHYEHKRSQDADKYEQSNITEKGLETTTVTSTPYYNTWATRNNNYTKSLPRVIVTASASVSDSNGKKLNYTVGNIVHAVKPLVPTNYDDYKETDVLLDPFFLDVPKIQKPRGKRSHQTIFTNKVRKRHIVDGRIFKLIPKFAYTTTTKPSTDLDLPFKVEDSATEPAQITILSKMKSKDEGQSFITINPIPSNKNNTVLENNKEHHWIPPDYVNDNYEPLTYSESPPSDEVEKQLPKEIPKIKTEHKTVSILDVPTFPIVMPQSPTVASFKGTLIDKNQTYEKLSDNHNKSKIKLTTESDIAKTTLDIAHVDTTTESFIESVLNKSSTIYSNKYRIKSVHLVNLSDKISNNFTCQGKKYFKFYPDKRDCRTFHICSPGLNPQQVLDIAFTCDIGTFFNHSSVQCIPEKPNDCEHVSAL